MSKLIMQFLFQTNQNKIVHCQNFTAITYHGFSTIRMTKIPTVTNRPNCYFLKKCKHTKFINIKQTHVYDITNIEDVEDIVSNDIDICDIDEAKLSSIRLRGVLYPESNDSIINKLKLCRSVQEVFDIVSENEQYFNHEHCSQAIVVLWDLQKLYEIAESSGDSLRERVILQEPELLKTYKANLNQHPSFNRLLHLTSITYKEMSPDALSCSFLYLRKMGVNLNNCLVQDLILQLEHLLATVEPLQFPLTALSRFSIGVFYDKDLRASLTLMKILPHIISNLNRIDSIQEFRTLTISLRTIANLMDTQLLNKYKMIIEQFINNGTLRSEHFSIIIKSLLLLDQPIWAQENIAIIRSLLLLCCGITNQLADSQISILQKVLNHHLEPYSLMAELEVNSGQILAEYKIGKFYPNESFVTAATSGKHRRGMAIAREVVNNAASIIYLTEIMPFITTDDMETCNKYWMKLLEFLQSPTKRCTNEQLYGVCVRYMHFSSNMSWYRNIPFEQQIIELLTIQLVEGVAGHIPSQFAHIASFLLAYDRPTAPAMPKHIVSRSLEHMSQFSLYDCEGISKGLSVAMDIRRRRNLTQEFLQQFVSLDAALNSRALQFLSKEESSSIRKLNKIMRAYIHRKGTIDTELFHQLVQKYEAIQECDLSSRGLRDIIYNLIASNCLIPSLIDKLISYCIKHKEHIIGDTVCKLVYSCYYLGYTPSQSEEFFTVVSQLLTRDREKLTGLGLLQGSLALSFFNHLPSSLIQVIFSVDFLEHLDEEIKHCFAKATYPVRIRKILMELNRAVCLDQPEAGVPWFHVKYCEEQHALGLQQHYYNSPFHSDVQHMLCMATQSKDYVQTNVSSPYGYNIDLQVCLDQYRKPVDIRKTDSSVLNKIAILLQSNDNFTTNVNQLKGYNQMKQRHLEMMGYRVISISDSLWNAMYMAEPKAKINHVKNLIWPSES